MVDLDHEIACFESFVIPSRKERWIGLAQKSTRGDRQTRRKLTDGLNHKLFGDIDPRFAFVIKPSTFFPERIAAAITSATGVRMAYCFSGESELDGLQLPIADALNSDLNWGTVFSFSPGCLAFYQAERSERGPSRFLLIRNLPPVKQTALVRAATGAR